MAGPYESRYGFTFIPLVATPILLGVAGAGIFTIVKVLRTQALPLWGAVAFVAGFGLMSAVIGWMALAWVVAAFTHRVALRVDADGVTLGRVPFPPSRQVTVPLRDVEAVVVFWRAGNGRRVLLVGLRLCPGAERPPGVPTPGTFRHLLYRVNTGLNPYPVDVYRPVNGWRLDGLRLQDALDSYGGGVPLLVER
jgi:hypothetical protein